MSATQESTAAAPAASPSLLRLVRFPVIVLAIFGGLFAIPWICIAVGYEPEWAMMPFFMTQWHGPLLAALIIGVWWLFFSGFRWLTRLGGLAVVVLLAVLVGTGLYFGVREVELTKGRIALVPRFHFIWETTANQELAAYLAKQPAASSPLNDRIGSDDFPRYRGANADGIVRLRIDTDWTKHPPERLWRHPSPGGYSGIAVAGNLVVTLEQRDAGESVVCYDRATGGQRWAYSYDASYIDKTKMGNGPRSTPTIHDGHIYTIGATGELVCLTVDGAKRWSANILDDGKAKNIKWGLTGSPLIVDDLVVANPGIDEKNPAGSSLIAYERATGKIRWRTGNRKAGYSSPQLATFAGVPQILLFDGEGLVSYDKTGKELWSHPWITDYEMNSIQPVVFSDGRVFISSEAGNGCAMLRVAPSGSESGSWSCEPVWQNKYLGARYANPVTDGKSIFGLHHLQGVVTVLDAETGKVKRKGTREGPGQLLLADGAVIVVNGDTGDLVLLDLAGEQLARYVTFEGKQDKTWNTPALAGDQLFVRNQAEIVCLKLPRR